MNIVIRGRDFFVTKRLETVVEAFAQKVAMKTEPGAFMVDDILIELKMIGESVFMESFGTRNRYHMNYLRGELKESFESMSGKDTIPYVLYNMLQALSRAGVEFQKMEIRYESGEVKTVTIF